MFIFCNQDHQKKEEEKRRRKKKKKPATLFSSSAISISPRSSRSRSVRPKVNIANDDDDNNDNTGDDCKKLRWSFN